MYRFPTISRAALGPILLVSLLVLLVFWRTPPPRSRIIADPERVLALLPPERLTVPGVPTPTPQPLTGQFIARGTLDVVAAEGLFVAVDQGLLAAEMEEALNYVIGVFGSGPSDRISAYVGLEPGCGIHGIAYTEQRTVQVFTCASLPRSRTVNIMAHEFVHQLAQDRYGPAHLHTDMILLEGLATWGAGKYWLSGNPDFATMVRGFKQQGGLLPLATSYAGRSIGDMNLLYYQWASFVEFLINTYGRAQFDALYVTGNRAPGSADYAGIYGKDLATLEQEWLTYLEG